MSDKSFIKGTVILMCANAISKILGAVFKIPLTYILKEEGMAIFNTAFSVYSMLLSFVISGFPLAISNAVSKNYALKNHSYIKQISSVSSYILAVIGFFMSVIMFSCAKFFAFSMKDPNATLAIKVLSPSIFLVALSTVYKGFFQGSVNMIPTAISQVLESVIRLAVGFYAAFILIPNGIVLASSGALFGITFGEFLATSMLFFMYSYSRKKLPDLGQSLSKKQAAKELLSVALPMFLCSFIISALNMLDTSIIRNALLKITFSENSAKLFVSEYSKYTPIFNNVSQSLKMNIDGARWLYGSYSGYAITVFNLPVGIIGALSASILPVIAGQIAVNNNHGVRKSASFALKLTFIIAIPFSFTMFFFSKNILLLLFNNFAAYKLLSLLAPCLIFLCVQQLFSSFLHASGSIVMPAVITGVGVIIKMIIAILIIPHPKINILGAPISAAISFFITMIFYTIAAKKRFGFKFCFKDILIKPLFCSLCMLLFMVYTINPLKFFLGENTGFIICAILGCFLYLLILILTKTLKRQ